MTKERKILSITEEAKRVPYTKYSTASPILKGELGFFLGVGSPHHNLSAYFLTCPAIEQATLKRFSTKSCGVKLVS